MEYQMLKDVPNISGAEFRAYYDKHFTETNCWACGKGVWILMTVEGQGIPTISFTRSPQQVGGRDAFHMPFLTLECANCHTLWRISLHGVLRAIRSEGGEGDGQTD